MVRFKTDVEEKPTGVFLKHVYRIVCMYSYRSFFILLSESYSYICRSKRQSNDFQVRVAFDFVLIDVYDAELSAGDIEEQTYEQFDALIAHVTSLAQDGGLDIDGLVIDASSLSFDESEIDCEEGGVPEYETFTCRE